MLRFAWGMPSLPRKAPYPSGQGSPAAKPQLMAMAALGPTETTDFGHLPTCLCWLIVLLHTEVSQCRAGVPESSRHLYCINVGADLPSAAGEVGCVCVPESECMCMRGI